MGDESFGFRIWFNILFGFFLTFTKARRHKGWSVYATTERFCTTIGKFHFAIGMDDRPRIIPYIRIINWEKMYLFKKIKEQDKIIKWRN